MIKFIGDGAGGQKVLGLGLTTKNLEMLKAGKPIHIIGKEIGWANDILIFWGETEEALVGMLLSSGMDIPADVKVGEHHDDDRQNAPRRKQ